MTPARRPPSGAETLSRRRFLGASLGAALVAAGPYRLMETLVDKPVRVAVAPEAPGSSSAAAALPLEQYLFSGTQSITDNGVVVSVPPLYHEVVTATLAGESTPAALQSAGVALEGVLKTLESEQLLTFTPAGLGLAVGWGLPYFKKAVLAGVAADKMPLDLEAPTVDGRHQRVLLPSTRFATDPKTVIHEHNDVVFVLASDSLNNISDAYAAVFEGPVGDLFDVTSIRMGFVDATQLGGDGQSLTKQMALSNDLAGADSIPDRAELFLGFTSTQKAALGPGTIANFESLGMTNQGDHSYFAHGTILALSHLYEDLVAWYSNNTYSQRVGLAFRPDIMHSTPKGTLTIDEKSFETTQEISHDIATYGLVGHSGSMQPVSRLQRAARGYAAGTAIPVRADFNTVDNPFAYSSNPSLDNWSSTPAAGVHFLSYVPTSFYFRTLREAMDGQTRSTPASSPFERFVQAGGISTSHRQNFLIPPRKHRSFPLAELLEA